MQERSAILLIGEYPPLLATRAQILSEWEVVSASPIAVEEALERRSYELLILCQSVPDATAASVLALATSQYPKIKVLALTYDGEECNLVGATTLRVDIYKPGLVRDEVSLLLNRAVRPEACG